MKNIFSIIRSKALTNLKCFVIKTALWQHFWY